MLSIGFVFNCSTLHYYKKVIDFDLKVWYYIRNGSFKYFSIKKYGYCVQDNKSFRKRNNISVFSSSDNGNVMSTIVNKIIQSHNNHVFKNCDENSLNLKDFMRAKKLFVGIY